VIYKCFLHIHLTRAEESLWDATLALEKPSGTKKRIDASWKIILARRTSPSPRYSIASVGSADNAGPIFRLRLSEGALRHRVCCRRPRYACSFLTSFPLAIPEQRENERLWEGFRLPRPSQGLSEPAVRT